MENEQRYKQLNIEGQETIRKIVDKNCKVFASSLDSQTETMRQRHDLSDNYTQQGFREQSQQRRSAEERASTRHDDIKRKLQEHEILADRREEAILAAINETKSKFNAKSLEAEVLDHLDFPKMRDREGEVSEQYRDTFEWVFKGDSENKQQWPSLINWLENGDGCYWVSGKPGCGKSTLVKFISDDPRTSSAIRKWAPRTRSLLGLEPWAPKHGIITAYFFFWNAGSYMQKSEIGLLQTLLYDLLCQCPAIISRVLPKLYETAKGGLRMPDLSIGQLKGAFQRLTEFGGSQFGICLFIDGLDEYIADHGTHTELAEFFVSLCTSSKIKTLLSARPLPAFEAVLGDCPKIRLQDLTVNDIDFYVRDRISKHRQVAFFKEENPTAVGELIKEITVKAEGVFLWVKLAVTTLLEGIQSYDSVEDLKKRISEFPSEMDDFYLAMLRRVLPKYRKEASKMLRSLTTFRNLGLETLTAFAMSLAMISDFDTSKIDRISEDEVIKWGKTLELRLGAICPGFFEVHRKALTKDVAPRQAWRELAIHVRSLSDYREVGESNDRAPSRTHVGEYESWKGAQVEFIHKTAADFLNQNRIQSILVKTISQEGFHPLRNLLQSCIIRANSFPCAYVLGLPSGEMGKLLSEVFLFAWHVEQQTGELLDEMLDELENIIGRQRSELRLWDSLRNIPISQYARIEAHVPFARYESFVGMAARHGLHNYVEYRISEFGLEASEVQARPLLFSLLTADETGRSFPPIKESPSKATLVKLLLEAGADPNESWYGLTAWGCLHHFCTPLVQARHWS